MTYREELQKLWDSAVEDMGNLVVEKGKASGRSEFKTLKVMSHHLRFTFRKGLFVREIGRNCFFDQGGSAHSFAMLHHEQFYALVDAAKASKTDKF